MPDLTAYMLLMSVEIIGASTFLIGLFMAVGIWCNYMFQDQGRYAFGSSYGRASLKLMAAGGAILGVCIVASSLASKF